MVDHRHVAEMSGADFCWLEAGAYLAPLVRMEVLGLSLMPHPMDKCQRPILRIKPCFEWCKILQLTPASIWLSPVIVFSACCHGLLASIASIF
jgi:hypothetical protein